MSILHPKHPGGVVYMLESPSGKRYIGQAGDFGRRMGAYRRGECHRQIALHAAIAKHGWENFRVALLVCGIQTRAALNATESAFISMLGTLAPVGYNLKSGGDGGTHSAESRARMSAARLGKTLSAETREKIAAAHRGKRKSPEAVAKMAAAQRGVPKPKSSQSRPRSPEHRAKLSAAQLGKRHSKETREKMSASHRGKKLSAETREKISKANRGRVHTVQARENMSAGVKAAWERRKRVD